MYACIEIKTCMYVCMRMYICIYVHFKDTFTKNAKPCLYTYSHGQEKYECGYLSSVNCEKSILSSGAVNKSNVWPVPVRFST